MQPPAGSFQPRQRSAAQSVQQGMQPLRSGEVAGDMFGIMTVPTGLQDRIGRIHGKEQGHQDDLGQQDIIGIAARPAVEIMTDEASQPEYIPAAKEDHAYGEYANGQELEGVDENGIEAAKRGGEEPVRS